MRKVGGQEDTGPPCHVWGDVQQLHVHGQQVLEITFGCSIDDKNRFPAGASVWSWSILPMSEWVSSRSQRFARESCPVTRSWGGGGGVEC